MPLKARALVLEEGPLTVGLVELDLLLVPSRLARKLEARAASLGVPHLIVAASHAHSAIGGFDDRLVAEVAATGRFRPAVEAAIVEAAARALGQAKSALAPAQVAVGTGDAGGLVRSRDAGLGVDTRIEKIAVSGEHGPIGELVLLSAHPTLVPRNATRADPDYPGRLAAQEEQRGQGVTFVLQSAIGNASAQVPSGQGAMTERFVHALAPKVDVIVPAPSPGVLGFSEAELPLPAPDASRLVPGWLAPFSRGLLCTSAPKLVALRRVQLGSAALLAVPGEPTTPVAHALEAAADARVIAVADGYVGYLDTPDDVAHRSGESRRQYFDGSLADTLVRTAELTAHRTR